MHMARVISICNQKGGVGKTTTAVNLGAYLAAEGKRVLLVDFDPQANASSALGYDPLRSEESVYHGILGHREAKELVRPSLVYNFHLIPSAPHLAGALIELVNLPEREKYLRKFLHHVRHEYDYVIIDLSPSVTLLTVNALAASDEVIIPVQAEYYSLEGLGQLLETVELLRKNLMHPLKVSGALLTMYDRRERLSREVERNLREHFPHRVFETVIPRSVALAEAPSFGRPVLLYRPDASGAKGYARLAREVISQEPGALGKNEIVKSPDFGEFNIKQTP